jgi:hypothetical protein
VTDRWAEFVAELATLPEVIDRLMAEHHANRAGRCVGCTSPGFGTPLGEWPCPLWKVAAQARRYGAEH